MSPSKPAKVFISATSGDLGAVRGLVKDALLKIGCMPVEQADFPPDYRKVAEFLASEIAACDAVIHLVGNRYGAEPDPASLPPGAVRRSYTQLEYDAGRRLNKQIYTLICADDFPFDSCEAEPDLKVLLQKTHRETLIGNGVKYERVATPGECNDKVRQLRLQLEDLARQMQAEHRRQMIAWSGVGITLCLLLVLGTFLWGLMRGTRDDVATTQNKVNLIDVKVFELLQSDLLDSISLKAGLDAQQVRQLVNRGKHEEVGMLNYATQLAEEKRYDAAYALSRFVGETALLQTNSDYSVAADAFLIAARASFQLATSVKETSAKLTRYSETETLAMRGLDALQGMNESERSRLYEVYQNLAMERARCFYYSVSLSEPAAAKEMIEKAVSQIDEALSDKFAPRVTSKSDRDDSARLALLFRRRANYLAEQANWVDFPQAEKLLHAALLAADQCLKLVTQLNDPVGQAQTWLAKSEIQLQLSRLVSSSEARLLLTQAEAYCVSGRGLLAQGADPATDAQIQAVLGLVKLRISTVAFSDAEATETRDAAVRILGEVVQTAVQGQFGYAAQVAAMGLLTAQSKARDVRAAETSFVSASTYGFNTLDQISALTEYAILSADKGQQGCLPLLSEAIKRNYGLQQKFSQQISPQRFFESTLLLAKAEIAMSRLLEQGFPDEFESWTPETSRDAAFTDLRLLTNSFSIDNAPRSWAAARMEHGKLMIWHNLGADEGVAAFEDALSVFERDSDPVIWAEINGRLADALKRIRPPQFERAVKGYEQAMQVFNVNDFPREYISLCSELSETYLQNAGITSDSQDRDRAEHLALRFATVASITWQMQFPDTKSQYEGQHQRLLSELKKTRSQSESTALDEFVEQLKAELRSTVK